MKLDILFDKIEHELSNINFPFSNRNITYDAKIHKPQGFVLGLTKNRYKGTYHVSKFTEKYPELCLLISKLIRRVAPNYEFTSVQLNKNILCKPHKDVFNKGESIIFGLGSYFNGGELIIENEPHDIKRRVLVFDGSKNLHWVNNWEYGDRYTVTCYNIV